MRFALVAVAAVVTTAGLHPPLASADFGTAVSFVDSPKEAAALARKREKLVFVLHVSGHFEDPGLT